jgi:hypothetical protein
MTLSDSSIQDAPIQVFDTTVDMSLLTNTPSFSQWNQARNSTGTVLHLFYALTVDSIAPQNVSVLQRTFHKMAREAACCDQTTEQKCNRCTKAMGINVTLPLHSYWTHGIGNESCAWACDLHYELGGDGEVCQFCLQPSCPVGRYWTKCGVCEDCTSNLPIQAAFTANGTTRYDPNSCPFKCAPGFYYNEIDEICVGCRTSAELNCSTRRGGAFFEIACTERNDAECMSCTSCALGYNQTTPCRGSTDLICAVCDAVQVQMPSTGATWRLGISLQEYCLWGCVNDLQYNPLANTCFECKGPEPGGLCPVGYYTTPCTLQNLFTACAPCVVPTNATVLSNGLLYNRNSCVWECKDEYTYNSTINECRPTPLAQVPRINDEWLWKPPSNICIGALPSICEWGQLLDTSIVVPPPPDTSTNIQDPCTAMCVPCPTEQTAITWSEDTRLYTSKGKCDWVCAHPFILVGGVCQLVQTQM